MKKFLLILGAILLLLIGSLAFIPVLFQDQIRDAINNAASKQIKADMNYESLDLSLFRNFPDISVRMTKLTLVGREEFAKDTLLNVGAFDVSVALFSVFGDQIKVNSIALEKPNIKVIVLSNGKANYDISIPSEEQAVDTTASKGFQVNLDEWKITEGNVYYSDFSSKMFASIENLNHEGSGSLSDKIFDLVTHTDISALSFKMEEDVYFSKNRLMLDMTLLMDNEASKYTLKENKLVINDFPIKFDGFVQMIEKGYDVDMSFASEESTFKSLLSLIPATFLKGYETLKTEGNFEFNGAVKGAYVEGVDKLPAFQVALKVKDGKIQYPELPSAISGIQIDMNVDNKDGIIDNTVVDIKSFALNLGSNPVDGRLKLLGLSSYTVDALINAKMNLEDISKMYPIEGTDMKGTFAMNVMAKGTYDSAAQKLPVLKGTMDLKNGYLKSSEYPVPLENLQMNASLTDETGKMEDFVLQLGNLSFLMDGKPFEIKGTVKNMLDYAYDMMVKGELDLEKLSKVYPIEGTTMSGQILADIHAQGVMSDLDAERYEKLPTSGSIKINQLNYVSTDMPQGMRITTSVCTFSPKQIQLESFFGFLGKSDVSLNGYLQNYLAYGMYMAGMRNDPATIRGNLTLYSKKFDTNEWMTEEETTSTSTEEATGIFEVPKDIDFAFTAGMDQVLYDNLVLENLKGLILMKDGKLSMQNVMFNAMEGKFIMNGTYSTPTPETADFDFSFDIVNANIRKTAENFTSIGTLAPIAKDIDGLFSTSFKAKGPLNNDMTPKLDVLSGAGLLNLKDAAFTNDKVISALGQFLGTEDIKNTKLAEVIMQAKIENGKLNIQPFNVPLGQSSANIQGQSGLDGSMDYSVKLTMPKALIAPKLQAWFGISPDLIKDEQIPLDLKITGNYANPKVGLDGDKTKQALKAKASSEVKKGVKDALTDVLSDNSTKNNASTDSTGTKTNEGGTTTTTDKVKEAADKLKDKFNLGKKKKNGGGVE